MLRIYEGFIQFSTKDIQIQVFRPLLVVTIALTRAIRMILLISMKDWSINNVVVVGLAVLQANFYDWQKSRLLNKHAVCQQIRFFSFIEDIFMYSSYADKRV